jgi:hypothetical protein
MSTPEQPRRLRAADVIDSQHEALMQALTRAPRSTVMDCDIGQEARTKEWYVKSLSVPMNDGEAWLPWTTRVGEVASALIAALPKPPADDTAERLAETVQTIDKARRKRGDAA